MKRETLAHFVHMATGLGRFIGSQPFCGVLGFILDDMSDLVHTFARDFFEPNAEAEPRSEPRPQADC